MVSPVRQYVTRVKCRERADLSSRSRRKFANAGGTAGRNVYPSRNTEMYSGTFCALKRAKCTECVLARNSVDFASVQHERRVKPEANVVAQSANAQKGERQSVQHERRVKPEANVVARSANAQKFNPQ